MFGWSNLDYQHWSWLETWQTGRTRGQIMTESRELLCTTFWNKFVNLTVLESVCCQAARPPTAPGPRELSQPVGQGGLVGGTLVWLWSCCPRTMREAHSFVELLHDCIFRMTWHQLITWIHVITWNSTSPYYLIYKKDLRYMQMCKIECQKKKINSTTRLLGAARQPKVLWFVSISWSCNEFLINCKFNWCSWNSRKSCRYFSFLTAAFSSDAKNWHKLV